MSHDYRGIMANKKQEPFTNTCVHLEVLDGAVLLVILVFFVLEFCPSPGCIRRKSKIYES
jgi:hypothetical protein